MKYIVVQIKGENIAVLDSNGVVSKMKNNNYEIGQVITIMEKRKNFLKKIVNTSALVASLLLISLTAYAYYSPVTYVSLDVNPSIEYSINRFDKVLSVEGANDDGTKLLENIDVKNNNIEEALSKTVDVLIDKGYLGKDTNEGVIISTSNKDTEKSDSLAAELKDKIQKKIDETGNKVVVEAIGVGAERVKEARELGITPGKLNLIEKLQKSSLSSAEEININDWINTPVKEINRVIKENRKQYNDKDEIDDDKDKVEEAKEKLEEDKKDKLEHEKDTIEDEQEKLEEKKTDKLKEEQDKVEDNKEKSELIKNNDNDNSNIPSKAENKKDSSSKKNN